MTPLLAAPVLSLFGFSAAGPVLSKARFLRNDLSQLNKNHFLFLLDTVAAGIQSTIGNVAAGSTFAAVQGAAMGAGVPVVLKVVGGAVTGVIGMAIAAVF